MDMLEIIPKRDETGAQLFSRYDASPVRTPQPRRFRRIRLVKRDFTASHHQSRTGAPRPGASGGRRKSIQSGQKHRQSKLRYQALHEDAAPRQDIPLEDQLSAGLHFMNLKGVEDQVIDVAEPMEGRDEEACKGNKEKSEDDVNEETSEECRRPVLEEYVG